MVLKIGSIGFLSMLILPAVFLLVLRLLGFSTDPLGLIFKLMLAEGISLVIALVLVLHFKVKARVPLPQT